MEGRSVGWEHLRCLVAARSHTTIYTHTYLISSVEHGPIITTMANFFFEGAARHMFGFADRLGPGGCGGDAPAHHHQPTTLLPICSRVPRKVTWLGTPSVLYRRPHPYHHIYPYLTDIIRGTRTYHIVSTYMNILGYHFATNKVFIILLSCSSNRMYNVEELSKVGG